jgi:hypothetical protein
MTLRSSPLLLVAVILSTSSAAEAACPTTPQNFNATDCQIGGVDVCEVTSGVLTCHGEYASQKAHITLVADFDTSNSGYEAWGDLDDTLFCCGTIPAGNIHTAILIGSEGSDLLEFTWNQLANNLRGINGDTIQGYIYGNAGMDNIRGSNTNASVASWLDEELYGGADCDTIVGNDGDDYLFGEDGADVTGGGSGDDWMDGGAEGDIMMGGSGLDTMLGGGGDDVMGGGNGNDQMDGGAGSDIICGGGSVDDTPNEYLYDGGDAGPNWLYAAESYDTDRCTSTNTKWDGNAVPVGSCGDTFDGTGCP